MTRVAVVGTGRWGMNHVRTLARMPSAELVALCDSAPTALRQALAVAPEALAVRSFASILEDRSIEAVVLATPASAHATMTMAALEADKHVLVEKPLALNVQDATAVADCAERRGLVLMVGHIMLFHPSIRRLKSMIRDGTLGSISRVYASRLNTPSGQPDACAMWSLAPHDISLALYLIDSAPLSVRARTRGGVGDAAADVAFVDLEFRSALSQMHLSRVHPWKERRTTVVGSDTTVEFDDTLADKLRVHPTGLGEGAGTSGRARLSLDPEEPLAEPLELECAHFLSCIRDRRLPDADSRSGVTVIRILEAAERSAAANGATMQLHA